MAQMGLPTALRKSTAESNGDDYTVIAVDPSRCVAERLELEEERGREQAPVLLLAGPAAQLGPRQQHLPPGPEPGVGSADDHRASGARDRRDADRRPCRGDLGVSAKGPAGDFCAASGSEGA